MLPYFRDFDAKVTLFPQTSKLLIEKMHFSVLFFSFMLKAPLSTLK